MNHSNRRCQCNKCDSALLNGAREYRCCHEVPAAIDKLGGEIQVTRCITQHEDYLSMAQEVVLENVGPLLKDRDGRRYKQKAGCSKNQSVLGPTRV